MFPVEVEFPKFVPDQLLTSDDLNQLFGYLDEQNRITRTNLIGIGIVCGLHVQLNNTKTQVTITKGCGVTSEGYLIAVNTKTYSQYKAYKVDTPRVYDKFYKLDGGGNSIPMQLWELKQPGVDPDLKAIDENFLKDKVILLFVELKEEDNKNCDPQSCDDKGINVTVSFLPMAVTKEDAALLLGTTGGSFGVNTYTALPELKMKRWDVPNSSPLNTKDIFDAYFKILDKSFIDSVETTLKNIYTVFGTVVATDYPNNPFNGLSAKFNLLYNGTININQLIHLQYYYDLFSDLLLAYQEFRKAGTHVLSTCCLDRDLFPRHLLLGEAIPSVSSGILPFRHYFIYSPLFDQRNMLAELKSLFSKLVLLTEKFFLPAVQGNNTKEDVFLRITPSMLWDVPLSTKAIPYYYNVNNGPQPLYLSWDYRRTLLNDAKRNLSYHANQYNAADNFVLQPLNYDLEPYNFLRIEGIVGKSYTHVLSQVKQQIQKNRLPVDIIALTTDTGVSLSAAGLSALRNTKNATEMLCHFQDLESMYDSMRREILCMLCKELKYYYDFTFPFLSGFLKKNIQAGETSQVDLFDVCSKGYTLKTSSLGMMIEFLYRKGFTDETLTLENFFEAFGINLQDANNDDIPDVLTGQVLTIYLTLLNFFKIPLGIIRLSTLLTEDLAEFDAKAYCEAAEKLAEYAKSIKALFAIFTGSKETAETPAVNTGAAAPASEANANANVNKINISSRNTAMLAAVAGSGNILLRVLAAILIIEDFLDHLDVLIYNCKCSALLSLKKDYMRRYAMLTRLRQFGYFTKMHPGIQHKAGVPMGGTFIIVYHSKRRRGTLTNNLRSFVSNTGFSIADDDTGEAIMAGNKAAKRKQTIAAGFVIDATNNKPIAGAIVSIAETGESTTTNTNGNFQLISSIIPFTLVVEAAGYEDFEQIKTDDDDDIRVVLVERKGDLVDEIQQGIVIADFYLPYRCCSDCPPVQYVVTEPSTPPQPPNQGPVANAGPDKEITLPKNNEQLDGSASTDPDGTITFFQWTKLSGPASFNIATPNSAVTGVTDLEEGVYVFELTVTDNSGSIARDTMQLKVNQAPPPENKPPVADAGPDRTITLSFVAVTTTDLDGSNSKDEDGTIVSQQWTKVSGPAATISSPNLLKTQVSLFEEGIYIFRLEVKDNGGLTDDDTVTITVIRPNQPPVADAGADRTVTVSPNNPSFTLDGSNSKDPEGGALTFEWKFEGGPNTPAISNTSVEKPTITGVVTGTYKFSLTVKDEKGAVDTDDVTITVRVSDVVTKTCGPLPDITESFRGIGANVSVALFTKFKEVFQLYGDVESFFKELETIQNESTAKLVDFFTATSVNELLVKWLGQLHQDIISNPDRKDLHLLALALYRILTQLAMYVVCIQKEDFDVAGVPMNRVFSVIRGHVKQWAELIATGLFSPGEVKMVKEIGDDIGKEITRTNANGEATAKAKYLRALKQILDIITAIP
jgi:hypothetical protein